MRSSYAISCIGGTDTQTDPLQIHPGAVMESLNYEALPEGGYRRIDGYHLWSGATYFPDPDELQIVYTDFVLPFMLDFAITEDRVAEPSGAAFTIVGFREQFDENNLVIGYYVAVQLRNPRRRLQVNDLLGSDTQNVSIVRDSDPEISDGDYNSLINNIYEQTNLATKPFGDGPIRLIHSLNESVYCVRDSGPHAVMYRAAAEQYKSGRWDVFTTFNNQAGHDNWRAFNNHFTARPGYSMYITNGNMDIMEVQIGGTTTGIPTTALTKPIDAIAHRNHLFLAYPEGQLYFSDSVDITLFSPIDGGGVINIGEEITGLQVMKNNLLLVTTENTTKIIEGTGKDTFVIRDYTREIGATDQTLQDMPTTIFCDRRGVYLLDNTDDSADYRSNTLSEQFDPLYRQMRREPMMSTVNREKSQYRLFNPSGRGLWLTFNNRSLAGAMAVDLGIEISCVAQSRNNLQRDEIFFGGVDGGVYRMDFGTSFNGDIIPSYIKFPYCHTKKPTQKKRWRHADLNMRGDPRTTLQARVELEDGELAVDNRIVNSWITSGKQVFNGDFTWDLKPTVKARVDLEGSSVNAAMVLKQDSASNYSHTIDTMIYQYDLRGPSR